MVDRERQGKWGKGLGFFEGGREGGELRDLQKKRPFQILRRSVRVKSRPDIK